MQTVLDTDRFALIQGDTLETLRTFADKSVDIVVTDPPYNAHVHEKLGKERRNDGHRVRDTLTFPPMTPDLVDAVMREYIRICKGWIISFSDFYNTHVWGEAARRHGGAWVRTGHWIKTNPMPQMTGDRPGVGHEDIVICHAEPKGWGWNGKGRPAIWRGNRPATDGSPDHHPNEKPAWLLQALLGMFAPPGGLVLDPYLGSGTTVVAALAAERIPGESPAETACPKCAKKILEQYAPPLPQGVNVIGIEGDPKYIALSIARIREAAPSLIAA